MTTPAVLDIPNEAYHADHGRLSSSMLKTFVGYRLGGKRHGGPAAYYRRFVLGEPDEERRNENIMLIGSVHGAMCDEPEKLTKRYVVVPPYAERGKAIYEAWLAEQPRGVIPVSGNQWRSAQRMAESVDRKFPEIQATPGHVEKTIRWTDEETGIDCKAKPDKLFVLDTGIVMVERKSTDRLSGFPYVAKALKYYLQSAHYAAGILAWLGKFPVVKFIVAEREEPYDCMAFDMPEEKLREAMRFRLRAMRKLKWCLTTGTWPETFDEARETA